MNVSIDHSEPGFFSDTVVISHTPQKFVVDFSQVTPRFDIIGNQKQQSLAIKHKTVILDPVVAKDFFNILKDNIKKYEKQFGTIKLPKNKKTKTKKLVKSVKSTESTRYIG